MLPKDVLAGLFDDKKVRILRLFVNNPEEEYYLREIGRVSNVPPATTYRIVNQLLGMDLVRLKTIKRTKLYSLASNEKTKLLRGMLEEKKSAVQEFVDFVSSLEGVEQIILHGKESKDKTNILIIGEYVDAAAVKREVGEISSKYGIKIIELVLGKEQYEQMSSMGLFSGTKKILWPK